MPCNAHKTTKVQVNHSNEPLQQMSMSTSLMSWPSHVFHHFTWKAWSIRWCNLMWLCISTHSPTQYVLTCAPRGQWCGRVGGDTQQHPKLRQITSPEWPGLPDFHKKRLKTWEGLGTSQPATTYGSCSFFQAGAVAIDKWSWDPWTPKDEYTPFYLECVIIVAKWKYLTLYA